MNRATTVCTAALLCMLLFTSAFAHTFLARSDPPGGSVVTELPSELTLVMSDPIEVRFSTFKVYRLETEPGTSLTGFAAETRVFVQAMLELEDEEGRADIGVLTEEATTDTIVIGLKEELPPGTYIVMWRLLSADTHILEDFVQFTFRPAGE